MGNNIKEGLDLIVKWLSKALATAMDLVKAGDVPQASLLLGDVQWVVTSHINALKVFFPDKVVDKFPGGIFKQLAWVGKNASWLVVLTSVISGTDPFMDTKLEAKMVARKWGFYDKVYA